MTASALRVVGENLLELFALPKVGDLVIGAAWRPTCGSTTRRSRASTPCSASVRGIRIKDLGSANGTRVADRALEAGEAVEIVPGEVVDLGSG